MATQISHVAIIGGGLCGLALAVALNHRSIPYKIYESRSSFTEIGAGINLGPNALRAFECIDPALGQAVHRMCTRNPLPKEDVWMQFRYGAPTKTSKDYDLITELMAPPTGNMTVHRNELLRLLARRVPQENVVFNKKLTHFEQTPSDVILHFADGSTDTASIVVGCDGIHSNMRGALLQDTETAKPQYTGVGAYRALLTMEEAKAVFGKTDAPLSQVIVGPCGYVVRYTVAGGHHVNVGLWTYVKEWPQQEWMIQNQRQSMLQAFEVWGDTVHRLMDVIPEPSLWACYCHTTQPEKLYEGRVCLIGDAAHSMPPHQGAGAGQAMLDAYIMAEALCEINLDFASSNIEAALRAYNEVRFPASQKVLETSIEAMSFLSDFHTQNLDESAVEAFKKRAIERWHFIWDYDLTGEGQRARGIIKQLLTQS